MRKLIKGALFCALLLAGLNAPAQDNKAGWELNLNRVSLNLTSTQVKHADSYTAFPNNKLKSSSQELIQGYFDFFANYYKDRLMWGNELLMQYGKTRVIPAAGAITKTENADQILATSSFAYSLWRENNFLGGFDFGPYIAASYDTEFTMPASSPRRRIFRENLGIKAYDGKYVQSLYAAFVLEENITFPETSFNTAFEAGLKLEQPVREGVKASYNILFRNYLSNGKALASDIDYELELDARLDVLVYGNLSIAPFINYYIAQGKYVSELGQNLYVGVSFSFSRLFKDAAIK
jgi:hypothetical protein